LHSPGQAVAGLISVSIVYALVSIIISLVGFEKVRKVIPPVVVGPVVSIIGLALAATAVTNMASTHWDVAIVSLLAAIIATLAGTKVIRLLPIIIGLAVGYVYAAVRGLVDFDTIAAAPAFAFRDSIHSGCGNGRHLYPSVRLDGCNGHPPHGGRKSRYG
jgi:uracil permease